MKKKTTYADLVTSALRSECACYELRHPMPGFRHDTKSRYVAHRFPVKGGFTIAQVIHAQMMEANPILSRLKGKDKVVGLGV